MDSVSNDTRRLVDIEARVCRNMAEKTYNIFWMVSKPGYLSPATQFPGCSPSQRCSSTNPPEIYVLCLPYRSLYFSIARRTIKKLERKRPFLFIRWKETFFEKRRSRSDLFYGSVLTYLVGPVLHMEDVYGIFYGGWKKFWMRNWAFRDLKLLDICRKIFQFWYSNFLTNDAIALTTKNHRRLVIFYIE